MNRHTTSETNGSSLTPLCLGRDEDRPTRRLAWTGSVCVLVLVVGFAGFGLPPFHTAEPRLRTQIVPVVFTAPDQIIPVKTSPAALLTIAPDTSAPVPHVASVAEISGAATFAVPMGVAALQPAVAIGHPVAIVVPEFTQFNPTTGTNTLPQPTYPDIARRRGQQGTVRVHFTVAPSGEVANVEIARSSGFNVLDAAAVEAVRNHRGFGQGGLRHHFQDITFQLK